ncbi:hypothetical protein JCM5353_005953 [Sporobolomyces roseus]
MAKNTISKKSPSSKKATEPKEPSTKPYHVFLRRRTAELKDEKPNQESSARRQQISKEWKESDENPINQVDDDAAQTSE